MTGSPDDIHITQFDVPGDIQNPLSPGATAEVVVSARNDGYVPQTNLIGRDDQCRGPNLATGAGVVLKVKIDGEVIGDDTRCITWSDDMFTDDQTPGREKTRTYSFTAPTTPGWHQAEFIIEGESTGRIFSRSSAEFKVAEEDTGADPTDGDTGGDAGDTDGSDGSDDPTDGDGTDGGDEPTDEQDPLIGGNLFGGLFGGGGSGPVGRAENYVQIVLVLAALYFVAKLVDGTGDIAKVAGGS
jgi:hypothetical protein